MKKISIVLFLLFNLLQGYSQSNKTIDSLSSLLYKSPKKVKIQLILELIDLYEKSNNDSALMLSNKGILLSQELKDVESEYTFKINKINTILNLGKNNEAIDLAEDIVKSISSIKNISNKKKDSFFSSAYNVIGISNMNLGNYSNALYYFQKDLELLKQMNDSEATAISYANIGLMFYNMYEDEKAISYYTKSKEIYEKLHDKKGLSGIALNIGALYHEKGHYQKALDNYFYSLKIEKELGSKKGESYALNNIADVYRIQKKYDKAIEFNLKSIALNEQLGNVQSQIYAFTNMCDLYIETNNITEAREFALKAYIIAKKHKLPILVISSLQSLSKVEEITKNYPEALAYQKLIIEAKDSLTEKNKGKILLELEEKYQNEQNQKDIKLKNAEINANKIEAEKKNLQTNFLMAGIIAVFLLAIVILRSYNQKKKINVKLEEINDELEKLSIVARETENVVIIADKDCNIEWINESYTKLYGFTLDEFKEKFGNSLLSGSTNPEINNIVKKCFDEKISVKYVLNNTTKTGEKKWVQTTMTPTLDKFGNIEKFILIDTDITKLQEAQLEIESQSKLLEAKNEQIIDSIDYAKRIQSAVFPSEQLLTSVFPHHFLFFKPKDIVSGDFYWVRQLNDEILFAVADCTGHGVPGAFMSIISINILNNIASIGETNPSKILVQLGERLIKNLNSTTESIKDGLDIAICSYNIKTKLLQYAGAHNSLYFIRDNELTEYKADKIHIGKMDVVNQEFTNHQILIEENDTIYLFTDGYVDQKGGEKGKKFYYPPFRQLVVSIHQKPVFEQEKILKNNIESWMKNTSQIDDMCVLGIKF